MSSNIQFKSLSHLAGVCELRLLELRVQLQAQLLQLDGVRRLEALSLLVQGGEQPLPLLGLLQHTHSLSRLLGGWEGGVMGERGGLTWSRYFSLVLLVSLLCSSFSCSSFLSWSRCTSSRTSWSTSAS